MKTSLLILVWTLATPPVAESAEPPTITLPVGTEIAIRTVSRIESKKANLHTEYPASLDDPIIVNGETVVPASANAFLQVTEVRSPGMTHRASLSLLLIAVMINGQRVMLETGKLDSAAGSQAKRTAVGAVGGAAGGAAIGALAGGALGAAVGAGAGAVGGAIAGKLTGKGVDIAPETRFTYRLIQPAVITPSDNPR
jgi:uncharacterized membrane protein